jgi:hypothetical protein
MSEFAQYREGPAGTGAKPPRPTIGYADLLAARLRRLATGRSTGTLPFSGRSEGAIYLRGGLVVGAESSRTPGFAAASPQASATQAALLAAATPRTDDLAAAVAPQAGGTPPAEPSPNRQSAIGLGSATSGGKPERDMLAPLFRVEPAMDAVLDLVLSQSAIGRFRTGKRSSGPELMSLPADSVIAEIARRLHLVRQMGALVTADTTVSRNPRLHTARIQVSALQWALLIRARTATSPRTLSWALGRSVFGTTTEVYRLVALHLLLAEGHAGCAQDLRQRDELGPLEPCRGAISFLQAVSDEKGHNGMRQLSDMDQHADGGR